MAVYGNSNMILEYSNFTNLDYLLSGLNESNICIPVNEGKIDEVILNIVNKIKEFIKKIIYKIQQLTTKFSSRTLIKIWDSNITEEDIGKALYSIQSNGGATGKLKIELAFSKFNENKTAFDIIEKIVKNIQNGYYTNDQVNEINNIIKYYYDDTEGNVDFITKADNAEDYIKKNDKLIKSIMRNKNTIKSDILTGKNIYELKKALASLQYKVEKAFNMFKGKTNDEQYENVKFAVYGNQIIDIMKRFSKLFFFQFGFCAGLSGALIKQLGKDDDKTDDKVKKSLGTVAKDYNKFDQYDKKYK